MSDATTDGSSEKKAEEKDVVKIDAEEEDDTPEVAPVIRKETETQRLMKLGRAADYLDIPFLVNATTVGDAWYDDSELQNTLDEKTLALYECCVTSSLFPLMAKYRPASTVAILSYLRRVFGVRKDIHVEVLERASKMSVPELVIMEIRKRQTEHIYHPEYTAEAFESEHDFESWKEYERRVCNGIIVQLMENISSFEGSVKVKVHRANDVASKDPNGFSDPYVIVLTEAGQQRTKVIEVTLNPEWEEEFVFPVSSLRTQVEFQMWDLDRFTYDDYLGDTAVRYLDILDRAEHRFTLDLTNELRPDDLTIKGTLEVSLQLIEGEGCVTKMTGCDGVFEGYLQTVQKQGPLQEAYSALLDAIIIYDTKNTPRFDVSVMSNVSNFVLGEFGHRYGVHRLFQKLCIIEKIAKDLKSDTNYYRQLFEELSVLMQLRKTITLNKQELSKFTGSMERLQQAIKMYLLGYKDQFYYLAEIFNVLGLDESSQICSQLQGLISQEQLEAREENFFLRLLK